MSVRMDPRALLRQLFDAAVARAQPAIVLPPHLPSPPKGRTVVIGAGKAAAAMAQVVEAHWPRHAPLGGVVVTRHGHVPPRAPGVPPRIDVLEAAHPVPDRGAEVAARRVLAAVSGLTEEDLVVCLMSGGASALLTLPVPGLDFAGKQWLHQQLLHSGADIEEMNTVRKQLSAIKGGRLAAACGPARVLTLAISDVPGDDPAVIGSGPTVPDSGTAADALAIITRRGLDVPQAVRSALADGTLETPKPGAAAFRRAETRVIATPWASLDAAAACARGLGLQAHVLGDALEGESREVARALGPLALASARHGQPFTAPCVILSGGETTVTVQPRRPGQAPGRGGRAGEFCLGLAKALKADPSVWALVADTDGIDGMEDNAGAWVAPDTLARAAGRGLDIDDHLARNDAHGYFGALGDLLITGPTFTNVNDFRAMLVTG
ncbi:MAG: hypothetical protein RL223_4696 [Pseudomonadota bacterium]